MYCIKWKGLASYQNSWKYEEELKVIAPDIFREYTEKLLPEDIDTFASAQDGDEETIEEIDDELVRYLS